MNSIATPSPATTATPPAAINSIASVLVEQFGTGTSTLSSSSTPSSTPPVTPRTTDTTTPTPLSPLYPPVLPIISSLFENEISPPKCLDDGGDGGYDVDLVDQDELPPDLKCAVCWKLLRDPVQLGCGHGYCSSCLTNFKKRLVVYSVRSRCENQIK